MCVCDRIVFASTPFVFTERKEVYSNQKVTRGERRFAEPIKWGDAVSGSFENVDEMFKYRLLASLPGFTQDRCFAQLASSQELG